MSLCVLALCATIQTTPMPTIVMPGVDLGALHDWTEQQHGEPNSPAAIVIIGALGSVADLATAIIKCAQDSQCTATVERWGRKLQSFGRRIVGYDSGPAVETITVRVYQTDADDDGDTDYVVDSWLENGYDQLHEYSDTWAGYWADVDDEALKQHSWLVAHGR